MEHTHFVSVAALVRNNRDEILLVKSPKRGWEYPGGLVEPGESLQDALRREIKEEAGVDVAIDGLIGVCKNLDIDAVHIDFSCVYLCGDLKTSDESTEVMWVSREAAPDMITYPLTKKRLRNMLSPDQRIHCFNFTKDPFHVTEENSFQTPFCGENAFQITNKGV